MKLRVFACVLALACAPAAPIPVAPTTVAQPSTDHPPADLRSEKLVRCLIDSPDGCDGCDKGDTCVYKQMKEYDCVYIVYGTKCE
ncbi:MAG TPA: hypothetical protein VMR50_21585 [Myxococcota bacterium]|nr:hypothetical protein [Myxococcota bacterium]